MLKRIFTWLRQEKVMCIAAGCAVVTMLLVPPDSAYSGYIDLRVLCLLLCLMAVVAGFQRCGTFQWLAAVLLQHSSGGRVLGVILILLPFFAAMLVTNDVALLTFVPFTLLLLEQIGCQKAVVPILVLQTIAANLGSMATPVGNPQNLFLYATYELSAESFFSAMVPLTLISLVCLTAAAVPILPRELPVPELEGQIRTPKQLAVYAVLFILCLLTVFRVLPYGITTVLVLLVIGFMDRRVLAGVDYALLVTFVCFFIVSGNLGRIEIVRIFLQELLAGNPLLTAVGASQIISNVPAAVLLSTFTDAWKPLLEGVNIGGLGTPIASLASLITLKLYLAWPKSQGGRFLAVFTVANVIGLVILITVASL